MNYMQQLQKDNKSGHLPRFLIMIKMIILGLILVLIASNICGGAMGQRL